MPYNITIVGLTSVEPTGIISNGIDRALEALKIGMQPELVWLIDSGTFSKVLTVRAPTVAA